jgi:eukaryotic-like serine/threonine-protein kinase
VFDVGGTESGEPYMVMEFLEGQDLGQLLESGGRLSVEAAADFLVQVCEAVAEAHSLGIVHRDLKPQNLFLTAGVSGEPLVKVLDFGISKVADVAGSRSLTQTASMMGSPMYMAPEQMRSAKNVLIQSDIWALGVVLHELLTLSMPFEAETVPELCLKVVGEAPRSPLLDRPDLPAEVVEIIARCLEKEPEQRYADAAELAAALAQFGSASTRVIAERARAIMGGPGAVVPLSMGGATPSLASPTLRREPSKPAVFVTTAAEHPRGRAPIVALAAAVGAVALGVGFLFLTRGKLADGAGDEPATSMNSSVAAGPSASLDASDAAPAATSDAPGATAPAPAVASGAPGAPDGSPAVEPLAGAAGPLPSASAAAAPSQVAPAHPPSRPPARAPVVPTAGQRPASNHDDIPALRLGRPAPQGRVAR